MATPPLPYGNAGPGNRTCGNTVEGGPLRVLKVVFDPIGVLGVDSAPVQGPCEALQGLKSSKKPA